MSQYVKWFISRVRILVEVVYSPEVAFTRNLDGPSYLVPFCALGVLFIVLSIWQSPFNMQWVQYQMEASGASLGQVEANMDLMRKSNQFALILIPIILCLKWTSFALLIWLTGQLLLEDLDYRTSLVLVSFSYLPMLLRDACVTTVLWLRGNETLNQADGLYVAIGLNLPFSSIPPPWDSLAGNINVFEIWYVLLLVVGLSKLVSARWQRAFGVILPNWIFLALVQLGMVSIGHKLQSSFQPQ